MILKKNFSVIMFIILAFSTGFMLTGCGQDKSDELRVTDHGSRVTYYTCGMHPSVNISVDQYNKGSKACPICNMSLTPVYKDEVSDGEGKGSSHGSHTTARESHTAEREYYGCGGSFEGECPHCDLGEADGECICGGHTFVIEGERIDCPVCGKPLEKLSPEDADALTDVVSRVRIKSAEIQLAGVQTESVRAMRLYKEIRTVGRVAYDPGLAVAQEEFIAAVSALDKIREGNIEEISARAANLVESSKRKLKLLGLGDGQIAELAEKKEVHTSLIMPEEKMWIYGDVYEFELGWVKEGAEVKVSASSLQGEEFYGVITSINPVFDPKTRSLRFRAEVDNPALHLRPEMYVDVVIMSMYAGPDGGHEVLAIPKGAVLDTGTRKIVWVDKGDNEYEGRIVAVGPEASAVVEGDAANGSFYPVLSGLSAGENVVTKANFLIDSQSQISGVAAAAYGGAVGVEEKKSPLGHQH